MKLCDLVLEVGTNPLPYQRNIEDDNYWELLCPELNLVMYLTRGTLFGRNSYDTVFIEFYVGDRRDLTGRGNEIKILSTVKSMLERDLKNFIDPNDRYVTFGAERSEESRVRLYARRAAPMVSQILGADWEIFDNNRPDRSIESFTWKKKIRKLEEKAVQSTWITDIVHNRENKYVTIRISNGRQFRIPGISRTVFERWISSPSKGQFFHQNIRGKFQISRIK